MNADPIRYSLQNRGFVCLMLVALIGTGAYAGLLVHLPFDAAPGHHQRAGDGDQRFARLCKGRTRSSSSSSSITSLSSPGRRERP